MGGSAATFTPSNKPAEWAVKPQVCRRSECQYSDGLVWPLGGLLACTVSALLVEPGQLDSGQLEQDQVELGPIEPVQLELGQVEPGQLEPGQVEKGQV